MASDWKRPIFLLLAVGGAGFLILALMRALPSSELLDSREAKKPETFKVAVKKSEPEPVKPVRDEMPLPTKSAQRKSLAPERFSTAIERGGAKIAGGGGLSSEATSRVVGDSSKLDRPPRLVYRAPLEFPEQAKAKASAGQVLLQLLVTEEGTVGDAKVVESEPPGVFEAAALQSARLWKFEPGISSGKTISAWVSQRLRFELN
jgi:protein TonB